MLFQIHQPSTYTGKPCLRGIESTWWSRIMANRDQGCSLVPETVVLITHGWSVLGALVYVILLHVCFQGYQFWTQADKEGNFSIRAVRAGTYNLFAWVPGIMGDYKYDAIITIKPGFKLLNSLLLLLMREQSVTDPLAAP